LSGGVSTELADFPEHLWAMCLPNERANTALQLVCQIGIYALEHMLLSSLSFLQGSYQLAS
jgi:hypothetical protein